MLVAGLCILAVLPVPGGNGEGAGAAGGLIDVLFYYNTEEYYWGSSPAAGNPDAVNASKSAATGLNRGFRYEGSGDQAVVEIGGLRPDANASWRWTLLLWNAGSGEWQPWDRDARELSLPAGEAIAWCPSDAPRPTPDPRGKYPWPMFRGIASGRGESLSPAPLTNLTWWTRQLDGSAFSTPCAAGGKLFAFIGEGPVDGRARVVCLAESDGRPLWEKRLYATGPQYSSPAFAEGKVFVGGTDGAMRALDARDGSILWFYDCFPSPTGITSSPVVWRGRLLFGGGDGFLYSLGLDGTLDWKTDLGAPVYLCSPAVLGDRAVIGTEAGRVLCLDLSDGSVAWTIELGGRVRATPALSPEGYAFVGALPDGGEGPAAMNLFSIHLKDGVPQWNASYPAALSSPALAAGGLYLGTGTEFVGHHPDRGTRSWGVPYGPVDSSPAAARGYVYFSTGAAPGTAGCVRVGGLLEWSLPVNGSFFSSPAIADGRLFAVTEKGLVLCLGRPPEPRVSAKLSAPASAPDGSTVRVTALVRNDGEAPASFTACLTVDNRTTSLKNGPVELPAGKSVELAFEWTAERGEHFLGLALNGTGGESDSIRIEVGPPNRTCAIMYALGGLLGLSAVAPLMLGRGRGKGGP